MQTYARYANDCLWPKADIRTESRSLLANDCFGEKSGRSDRAGAFMEPDGHRAKIELCEQRSEEFKNCFKIAELLDARQGNR